MINIHFICTLIFTTSVFNIFKENRKCSKNLLRLDLHLTYHLLCVWWFWMKTEPGNIHQNVTLTVIVNHQLATQVVLRYKWVGYVYEIMIMVIKTMLVQIHG